MFIVKTILAGADGQGSGLAPAWSNLAMDGEWGDAGSGAFLPIGIPIGDNASFRVGFGCAATS
ncbi:hypothetical protein [Arhodomonas sp. SL1]|uniref:hypothetical protein n=1 Tax=Arhodomonas sp. SL1 TaxID=3425691 RepID=UPI003F882856